MLRPLSHWSTPLLLVGCGVQEVFVQNDIVNVVESCCGCCDGGCDSGDDAEQVDDSGIPTGDSAVTTCSCPEGYEATPQGDACVRETSVDATLQGTQYQVCPGNQDAVYGKFGARAPDGTAEQSDYWGDDDGQVDGRLNDVGVWTCDPDDPETTSSDPVGEWIGFVTCVEIDEAADYLVGIAGDNRVRLVVDGTEVLLLDGSSTANFNYWWLQPLSLSSGKHLVELTGYNVGSIASFGAEFSGPFATGSLDTDADVLDAEYAENLVFSTGRMVGETFDVGEKSGWVCPDGFVLDLCVDEAVCTQLDYVECE